MNIYETKTALHFQNLLAGIDNLWKEFEPLSTIKYKEYTLVSPESQYGFSLISNKKTELFIGLWMDYWVQFGIPCVITLDITCTQNANGKKLFEKILIEFPGFFEKTYIYDGTLVIQVKEEFIVNFEMHKAVANKIVEFALKSGCF